MVSLAIKILVNFKTISPPLQYVREGDCFLLVYAINNRQTFEEVKAMHQWINRLRDQDMPMVRNTTYILVQLFVSTIYSRLGGPNFLPSCKNRYLKL